MEAPLTFFHSFFAPKEDLLVVSHFFTNSEMGVGSALRLPLFSMTPIAFIIPLPNEKPLEFCRTSSFFPPRRVLHFLVF